MKASGWGWSCLKELGEENFQKEEALFPVAGEYLKAHMPNLPSFLVRGKAYLFTSEWSVLIQYKNIIYPWAILVCLWSNCLSCSCKGHVYVPPRFCFYFFLKSSLFMWESVFRNIFFFSKRPFNVTECEWKLCDFFAKSWSHSYLAAQFLLLNLVSNWV